MKKVTSIKSYLKGQKNMKIKKRESNKYQVFEGSYNYYYETHNQDGQLTQEISLEDWFQKKIDLLKSLQSVEYFALILHNKDINEKGELSSPHIHFVIKFKYNRSFKQINKETKSIPDNHHFRFVENESLSLIYLNHFGYKAIAEGKYIYSFEDLVVFKENKQLTGDELRSWHRLKAAEDLDDFKTFKKSNSKTKTIDNDLYQTLLGQLRRNEITLHQAEKILFDKYGEEQGEVFFIQKQQQFETALNNYSSAKIEEKSINKSPLKSLYIYAPSGQGKSILLQKLISKALEKVSESKAYTAPTYSDTKTYDLAQKYAGESVLEMDDFSPYALGYDEFLKLFPRGKERIIASVRNSNKELVFDYAFLTKSMLPEDFAKQLSKKRLAEMKAGLIQDNEINIISQPLDRINLYIKMTDRGCLISRYDIKESQKHNKPIFTLLKSFEFETIKEFREEKNQEILINYIFETLKESEQRRTVKII